MLLNLASDRINPFTARWFFYDKSCSRDGIESFMFFLVCDGQIENERTIIFRHPRKSEFHPRVLQDPLEVLEPMDDNNSWQQAETAFCYRKFYTETRTGQLMMLRPDQPTIYYHSKNQSQLAALGVIDRRLQRTNVLLTVGIVLAVIAIVFGVWL